MREEVSRIRVGGPNGWASAATLALILAVGGCAKDGNATQQVEAPTVSSSTNTEPNVLATVGAEEVTMAEVRAAIGEQLDVLEMRYLRQRHKAIEGTLDRLVRDKVLAAEAKKVGKGLDQLINEAAGGSVEPTSIDVQAWYNQNQARLGGRPLAQVESQIVELLRTERRNAAAQTLQERLHKDYSVAIKLEPIRVTLNNEGAPAIGDANAPVTVVEFSDFQCPYCKGFVSTINRLKESHGKQVRIVYRQYPIPNLHANAIKAAEASLCANEQGKFWEMHDLMFEEQNKLTVSELKEKAGRLKMNKSKFDNCMDTGRHVEQVQNDMKEGLRSGVTGTPSLFINGVQLEGGAVSYETLVKAIEKELARVQK
jgi:protein-disulfide isomerase